MYIMEAMVQGQTAVQMSEIKCNQFWNIIFVFSGE